MLDAKVPREAYRTIARCAPVRWRASLGRSRRYSLAGLNTLTTHVEPASVTASDAPPWFQRILPCAAARGTTASVDPPPYGPERRSTRSSVSNRAAFPRARDTLLASSRATRRSGRFARFRPNVRPPARTTCFTQSRIPSYASCPWRRNDPLSDTETPATTGSCEVTPLPRWLALCATPRIRVIVSGVKFPRDRQATACPATRRNDRCGSIRTQERQNDVTRGGPQDDDGARTYRVLQRTFSPRVRSPRPVPGPWLQVWRRGLRHHAHLWPSYFQGARAHRPTLSVSALSAHRSRAAAGDNGRRHRGGAAAKSSAPRAGGRLLGHPASLARPRSVRSEDLRPRGTDRHRGVRAAASPGAGGSLPRRNSRVDPVDSSRAAGSPFAARQDAQLFERDRGESRGEGSRPRSVGRTSRHERESRRGYGQQYLPGPWRNPVHPARAIRACRHQPRNRDRSRTRTRCGGCGEGPRPLRRVQRRRGISDFDQPLHLSGAECERRPRRVRDSRADHAAAQRRVLPDRRLRFCRPIPEAARVGRATTRE